jgi:hypothetical protein
MKEKKMAFVPYNIFGETELLTVEEVLQKYFGYEVED